MTKFIKVKKEDIKELASLASAIWHEYWPVLLTPEQIDYMVENFQSENAINNQYDNENYTYYFIRENDKNIGYFGVSAKQDYLFLSKLYISKDYRAKGLGTMAFEKIKEIAQNQNYKKIQLTVNKHNESSVAIYKKWGFYVAESVRTDIGGGYVMDDYIMRLDI